VPGAGDKLAIGQPEGSVGAAAGGQDGAAVLQRNTVDLPAMAALLQLITHRADQQAGRRGTVCGAQRGDGVVRDALYQLALAARIPGIAGNAAYRRCGTAQKGGMANGGDRWRRLVVCI